MRTVVFAALVGAIATPERPTEVLRGSFKCAYLGTWGCAPPDFPQASALMEASGPEMQNAMSYELISIADASA